MENKNYKNWGLEELKTAEKKINKQATISRFLIGYLVGVLIYGITLKGLGFLHIFLPVLLISGIYKQSQKQKLQHKEIQAAIRSKTNYEKK